MAYNASSGSRNFGDIKFEDDTDTQLDWSADSIAFKTNDVTRFVIDNDGIGVATSPSAPLHVYKAATSQKHTPDELLRPGGSDHGGSIAVVREAEGDADSAAAMSFYTAGDDSAPTEKARITSTGKFGIGTTSPAALLDVAGDIFPSADDTHSLGSASKRWANVYTADLHLRNDRGDWTVIEEEEYLSLRNNKTGKRYKLSMEEID